MRVSRGHVVITNALPRPRKHAKGDSDDRQSGNALEASVTGAGVQMPRDVRYPERRFKVVFEAYLAREVPKMSEEHPGLRYPRYKELLFRRFRKSPENPSDQRLELGAATKEAHMTNWAMDTIVGMLARSSVVL